MSDDRSLARTERLDSILPKSEVSESKSETENVTLTRLKHETIRFGIVEASSTAIVLIVVVFLIINYNTATPDTQSKIIGALVGVLSAALGVFIGKRL